MKINYCNKYTLKNILLEFAISTSAARLILQILAKYFSMYTKKSFNNCIISNIKNIWITGAERTRTVLVGSTINIFFEYYFLVIFKIHKFLKMSDFIWIGNEELFSVNNSFLQIPANNCYPWILRWKRIRIISKFLSPDELLMHVSIKLHFSLFLWWKNNFQLISFPRKNMHEGTKQRILFMNFCLIRFSIFK